MTEDAASDATVPQTQPRVDEETGEQFFAPHTVECLQEIILGHDRPSKVIETPVYEYAE